MPLTFLRLLQKASSMRFSPHEWETQSHLYSIFSRAVLSAPEGFMCVICLYPNLSPWIAQHYFLISIAVPGPLSLTYFTSNIESLLVLIEYRTTCKQWSCMVTGSGSLHYFSKPFIRVYPMCRGAADCLSKVYGTTDILSINHFQLYWLSLCLKVKAENNY